MAGHSKWAKVKHLKGAVDAQRATILAKLSKEIMVAAKSGADLAANPVKPLEDRCLGVFLHVDPYAIPR